MLLCLYRIGASFVLTTLLYVSDTHKRILLWLQLASIVWILVCGVLTTGRFFAALVSGDTALVNQPRPRAPAVLAIKCGCPCHLRAHQQGCSRAQQCRALHSSPVGATCEWL